MASNSMTVNFESSNQTISTPGVAQKAGADVHF